MKLENGYEMKTTFWQDFSIAERYGEDAIVDTYHRVFEWKKDIVYMTELAIVLNHKIWQHWEQNGDCSIARLYDTLWRNVDEFIMEHFNDEQIQYYLKITD